MPCVVKPGRTNWSWTKCCKERPKNATKSTEPSGDGVVSPSQLGIERRAMRLWLTAIHANILESDQKTNSFLLKRRLAILNKFVDDGIKLVNNSANTSPGAHKTLLNIHKAIISTANTFKITSTLAPPVYAQEKITADVRKVGRFQTVYRTLMEAYRVRKGQRLQKASFKKTRKDLARLARRRGLSTKPKRWSYFHRNIVERMSNRTHGSRIKTKSIARTKFVTLDEEEKVKEPRGEALKAVKAPYDTSKLYPKEDVSLSEARPPLAASSAASPEVHDTSPRLSPRSPRSPVFLESDTDLLATSPRSSGMLPPLEKSPKLLRKKKVVQDAIIDDIGLKAQRLSVALPPIKKSPETSPRELLTRSGNSNATTPRVSDTGVLAVVPECKSGSSLAESEAPNTEKAIEDMQAITDLHSSENVKPRNDTPGKKRAFFVRVWNGMKKLFCGNTVYPL